MGSFLCLRCRRAILYRYDEHPVVEKGPDEEGRAGVAETGAVPAGQGMDLAGPQVEIDAAQRRRAASFRRVSGRHSLRGGLK